MNVSACLCGQRLQYGLTWRTFLLARWLVHRKNPPYSPATAKPPVVEKCIRGSKGGKVSKAFLVCDHRRWHRLLRSQGSPSAVVVGISASASAAECVLLRRGMASQWLPCRLFSQPARTAPLSVRYKSAIHQYLCSPLF